MGLRDIRFPVGDQTIEGTLSGAEGRICGASGSEVAILVRAHAAVDYAGRGRRIFPFFDLHVSDSDR